MSKTCQNCNNVFDDGYNICPRCGMQYIAPQQAMPGQFQQPGMPAAPYAQPSPQYRPYAPAEAPMTVGQWLGTILLTSCFGIVSIILLFVWGFSDTTPSAKKNYCRAMLILQAIAYVLCIIIVVIVASVLAANGESILETFKEAFGELTSAV